MKSIIRLTESELHAIVANAVNNILRESGFGKNGNGYIKGDIYGTKLPKGGSKFAKELMKQSQEKENVNEEGEIGGGGATNCVGINVGGAAGQAKNHIDAPAFGGKNKKKVGGNAFSEPIMRQKHNLGDVTQAKANQVDMKPALDRTPGFSMGERKK